MLDKQRQMPPAPQTTKCPRCISETMASLGWRSTRRLDNHGTVILTKILGLMHRSPLDMATVLRSRRRDSSDRWGMQNTLSKSLRQ